MESAVSKDTLGGERGFASASGAAVGSFTIIKSLRPERVGKRYYIDVNGKLAKHRPIASICRGRARTIAATAANFVKALRKRPSPPIRSSSSTASAALRQAIQPSSKW